MESLYWVILGTTISLLIFKLLNNPHERKKLPPGPPKWPIIGNLNLLGSLPHQSMHNLSQTYGKLMYLTFGSSPVVVASSPDMARYFLKTHDDIFASRPHTAAGKYTTYNCQSVIWAPYGAYWNQGRKIYLNELFSPKKLGTFEHVLVQEKQAFLSRLHSLSGDQMVLRDPVFSMNLSVISRIALGRDYFSDSNETNEELKNMLGEFFILNGVFNIGDWIPCLRFIDLQGYVKRMKAIGKKFDRFNEYILDDHRTKGVGNEFVPKDMVDVLLKMADDPNHAVKIDINGVKGVMQDLIVGATETTTVAIEWVMSELIKQPNLIKKATDELDRVISNERWVTEADFANLPFTDSILKETMRLHPPAVLLAPHSALEDCKVDGYDIAKGTTVFINAWSMGRDQDLWDDPESFRPERFLGRDIDVKGQHFELLPFGSGRRMCPGYRLGLKTLRELLGNMLHGFDWNLPKNMRVEDVDMEEVFGLSTKRKNPLVLVAKPRLPGHMYN